MKAQVAPLEGNKVKLSVEVEEAEVEKAIDDTFVKFSKELRVPGFRPGKAPRRVLEARIGRPAARQEALEQHIPFWYDRAVHDKAVDAIAEPEIEITAGKDDGAFAFDAVVEVRPQLKLEGYESLKVVIPNPAVTEEEIQAQIDRLRGNFAELAPVEREARNGDSVVIDLAATRDGKPVAGMSYTDYSVELGAGNDLPELDQHLPGTKSGDKVNFEADLGGSPVQVEVEVKQVQEKILPEATDEWASEASEFSTVAELRADIEKRLSEMKRVQSSLSLRNGTLDALVALVQEEPPVVLVDAEVRRSAEDLGRRLDSQGIPAPALPRGDRSHHRGSGGPAPGASHTLGQERPGPSLRGGRRWHRAVGSGNGRIYGAPGDQGGSCALCLQRTGRAHRAASRGTLRSEEEQGFRLAGRAC